MEKLDELNNSILLTLLLMLSDWLPIELNCIPKNNIINKYFNLFLYLYLNLSLANNINFDFQELEN